jgi:chromosomal replication initiator protein
MNQVALSADLWERTLDILKEEINPVSFNTWCKPLRILSVSANTVVLGHTDSFAVGNLKKRYATLFQAALSEAFARPMAIQFRQIGSGEAPEEAAKADVGDALNAKYTFDTFVVGTSNRFAHAASLAVAELPSDAYNPLFLYGGVGLGKTHLMHAIGHYILSENPDTKLLYITSERFTNDVIDAIQKKTSYALREKLRTVDVLMVDDIQFIAGKTATQEEFFHTFNHLHASGKQIVLSSDRPPKDIPTLEERLRSRFEWGLVADIQKPDYETRLAILRRKAKDEHIDVPDDVLSFIADQVRSNIRELEGSLTRVYAQTMVDNHPIDMELAQRALSSIIKTREARSITAELVLQTTADYYHIDRSEILSQRRNREIALPRQIAMFLCREMINLSTTRIGNEFGGRDHTTVMHACKKIDRMAKENAQFSNTLDVLRAMIKGR